MRKTIISIVTTGIFVFSLLNPLLQELSFAASQACDYLCEIGISYYKLGKYEDALHELNKVLLIDPYNTKAKEYIDRIFQDMVTSQAEPAEAAAKKTVSPPVASVGRRTPTAPPVAVKTIPTKTISDVKPSKEEAMDVAFRQGAQKMQISGLLPAYRGGEEEEEVLASSFGAVRGKPEAEEEDRLKVGNIIISGEAQARLGIVPHNTYWKRANWDLNEKNFRMLSDNALDRRENSYDPRIYDRLKVKLDTDNESGFGFHTNITIDPWSFTGKSDKITVTSVFGDTADIQLKYWAATGHTLNETIFSNRFGNSFNLHEKRVSHSATSAFSEGGAFVPADTFYIPETKIHRQFQPVRELWLDYKQDNLNLRIFPIAYENQALTFDDPLRLSNNRIWWEDSPWLWKWRPGNKNSGLVPVDFNKGMWDNTLSFFTRDSEGQRLTALRGFSFEYAQDGTSLTTSVATPKDIWQEYSEIDNFLSASRVKASLTDSLDLGVSATTRLGYDLYNDTNKPDAENYVFAADLGYEVVNGIKTTFEVARSNSKYDLGDSEYKSELGGNAYHFSLFGRFPMQDLSAIQNGFDGIQPDKEEEFFTKFRFFAARMDESFDQPLSSYVETRDDEYWGRHLHFRKPFQHYYQGEGRLLTWDDVRVFKIGNGIDIGRSVLGLRVESSLWDKKVDNLFDVRNVHTTEGKFVENVARDELTLQFSDKLTTKFLGIYQKMPKTLGGTDPFVFNPQTRRYYDNDYIQDGMNTSLKTGSMGLEYAFFDWLALNGIWECTNDYSLAYDNFPRGIFNGGDNSISYEQNGRMYRGIRNWLYSQDHFPAPPYPFYDIFKSGLRFLPFPELEIYLDYTRNEYEYAGQVDDNMNHIGLELAYTPIPKIGIFLKYTYSRWKDLDRINEGLTTPIGHHNFFAEFIYRKSEDEDITFQYGEASRDPFMGGVLDIGWDPYGGASRTIDTEHIVRAYYRKKF